VVVLLVDVGDNIDSGAYLDITITGINNTGTFVMDSVIVKTEVTKRKVSKNICDCLYDKRV
jgi:hypothetical protein